MSIFAAAAPWYAKHGIPVFPVYEMRDGRCTCEKADCGSPGKHPLTANGFKAASTDEAQIADWCERFPDANIAMPTGAASGFTVIDVDPRHGGDESLESLIHEHGQFPDTAQQITGGGGRHFVFSSPRDPLATAHGILPGIDLQSEGAYILVAPSITKGSYIWDGIEGKKALLHPAELPPWVLGRNGNGAKEPIPDKFSQGQQNTMLFRRGCQLRHLGLNADEISAALWETNVSRCEEPGPRQYIDDLAKRIVATYVPNARADVYSEINGQAPEPPPPNELANYPAPIGEAAYIGLAARFVRLVEPHTEADASLLMLLFLTYAGNVLGREAYVQAGGDLHYGNLFLCAVGGTSSGRKGSAFAPVEKFFERIDSDWFRAIPSGLSSGEGLIWCVRDAIFERKKVSEKGKPERYEETCTDAGVTDKRQLVRQTEFFGALQAMKRSGSTLSATIRDAWDRGNLNSMTKNSPAKATAAHISIVGNVTKEELLRGMQSDEMDNGFANRFLWACSKRSKELPEGGKLLEVSASPEFDLLARDFQRIVGLVKGALYRDQEAADTWGRDDQPNVGMYHELTRARQGLFGLCTLRAHAQVLRLSLGYALLDGSREIRIEHLNAAYEIWRYCEDSAVFIFGDTLVNPVANRILEGLKASPTGLTRRDISGLFMRNRAASEIDKALAELEGAGLAHKSKAPTDGRPAELWRVGRSGGKTDA